MAYTIYTFIVDLRAVVLYSTDTTVTECGMGNRYREVYSDRNIETFYKQIFFSKYLILRYSKNEILAT